MSRSRRGFGTTYSGTCRSEEEAIKLDKKWVEFTGGRVFEMEIADNLEVKTVGLNLSESSDEEKNSCQISVLQVNSVLAEATQVDRTVPHEIISETIPSSVLQSGDLVQEKCRNT